MLTKSFKKTAVAGVATVLCGLSFGALAHTSIQDSVIGGATGYNNVVIGHGCTDKNDKKYPVVAQSVLFPTVNPILTVGSSTTPDNSITLSDIISNGLTYVKDPDTGLDTDVIATESTLANVPQLIQNKDIFKFQSEKTNSLGNVIGFNGYVGKLDPTLHGLVPFRTSAVKFLDTTGTSLGQCTQKLVIKIAVADICKMTFPPKEGTANLWMPNTTTKFTDDKLDGIGSPAQLTVTNPDCDSGATVTVWPSDEDIDANLIIPKKWGR